MLYVGTVVYSLHPTSKLDHFYCYLKTSLIPSRFIRLSSNQSGLATFPRLNAERGHKQQPNVVPVWVRRIEFKMNDQRVVRFETIVSKPKWYSVIASHIIKHSFLLKVIGFPLYYVSGVIFYTIKEGWTVLQATYFITVTITTCGYGFFHPTSDDSKLFTIFYIFFGLIIVFTVVSDISNSVLFDSQAEGIQFIHRHVNKYLGRGETQLSDASTRFYQLQFSLF